MATPSLEQLEAWREKLQRARFSGVRVIKSEIGETHYRDDAELQAAIAEVDRQILAAGKKAVSAVRVSTSKGL